ncbi:hypothetical protein D9757_014961 [Collybiopsis confluens]|uniref:Fruit-body specific protein a n=1 Tax=Collybiopsis confluens TaxID=2823264 RepID=A0A8H5D687_9AGAR|nr:hypothetical protein D9757_014961 [Collybiopsis confluens]
MTFDRVMGPEVTSYLLDIRHPHGTSRNPLREPFFRKFLDNEDIVLQSNDLSAPFQTIFSFNLQLSPREGSSGSQVPESSAASARRTSTLRPIHPVLQIGNLYKSRINREQQQENSRPTMFSPARLLIFATLAISFAECQNSSIVAPSDQGVPIAPYAPIDINGSSTDISLITSAALQVDQKSGAHGTAEDTPPNQPVSNTAVIAVDGVFVNETASAASRRDLPESQLKRRNAYDFVFGGNGYGKPDAAIQGTAYLTYTLVNNNTYNMDDCFAYCDSVEQCVFVNLYYEFNNPLLDFVYPEKSNLRCVLYADIHNASEKTYFGGQQLYPAPGPLNSIEDSAGWAVASFEAPPNPPGYEQVFGPSNGATNAGFAFLDKYDVLACGTLCNERGADAVGGVCQFFNIWRALVNGEPTTYTCSMYYIPTDESTAVDFGQGDLQVSISRGYKRLDVIVDGGFEGYTCDSSNTDPVPFCFTNTYYIWMTAWPLGGFMDAAIVDYAPYARTGHSVGLLGSIYNNQQFIGTLEPDAVLRTQAGATYMLQFYHSSLYAGEAAEASASMQIIWNGEIVATLSPGFQDWTREQFTVLAQGVDALQFTGVYFH